MTGIEADVREIKERTEVLTETIDKLLHEREDSSDDETLRAVALCIPGG
jgi:hypothetical protein